MPIQAPTAPAPSAAAPPAHPVSAPSPATAAQAPAAPGTDEKGNPSDLRAITGDGIAFSLMVGVSVHDTTLGTLVANLGYDKLVFPNPVFAGDTLRSESECLEVRESKSRPNAGIVTWAHRSFNQRDEVVCECTRTALLQKRPQ